MMATMPTTIPAIAPLERDLLGGAEDVDGGGVVMVLFIDAAEALMANTSARLDVANPPLGAVLVAPPAALKRHL